MRELSLKGEHVSKVTVSVIIPTHNRRKLLEIAVQSVFDQTFQDFEIIIINDASSDSTNDMLHHLQILDRRINIITNNHSLGGSKSRNLGIAASQGTWIAFLDDDDKWLPDKLQAQLQALASHPNAIACSSAYIINYPLQIKKLIYTPSHISIDTLLKSNALGGTSVCICESTILKRIGGFDESLKSSQDWDLWLRLLTCGEIISIKKPLVHYYVHFNFRISNNMCAKYSGSRRFYFKHKSAMTNRTRMMNLSFICFIKSRQKNSFIFYRLRNLLISMKYTDFKLGLTYFVSSFPRIAIMLINNLVSRLYVSSKIKLND